MISSSGMCAFGFAHQEIKTQGQDQNLNGDPPVNQGVRPGFHEDADDGVVPYPMKCGGHPYASRDLSHLAGENPKSKREEQQDRNGGIGIDRMGKRKDERSQQDAEMETLHLLTKKPEQQSPKNKLF